MIWRYLIEASFATYHIPSISAFFPMSDRPRISNKMQNIAMSIAALRDDVIEAERLFYC